MSSDDIHMTYKFHKNDVWFVVALAASLVAWVLSVAVLFTVALGAWQLPVVIGTIVLSVLVGAFWAFLILWANW